MVLGERAPREQGIDEGEPGGGAVAHGHRDRAVQLHHRRGIGAQQHVVEAHDPRPVGGGRGRRLRVHRGDGGLQGVGADAPRGERPLHQRDALRDQLAAPAAAVLLLEQDELAAV